MQLCVFDVPAREICWEYYARTQSCLIHQINSPTFQVTFPFQLKFVVCTNSQLKRYLWMQGMKNKLLNANKHMAIVKDSISRGQYLHIQQIQ